MAQIPLTEQFIGLSQSVDTTERRSALINAESQAYTMQDIVDTVGNALPPSAPLMYIANVNQLGTNNPDSFLLYNDFNTTSIVRNGVGFYTFVFDAGVINYKTIATIQMNGFAPSINPGLIGITVEPTNNTVYISTRNISGVSSDDILNGCRLQIQVYE